MPPELSPRLVAAMRASPRLPMRLHVHGEKQVRRYRAAIAFIKATDLVRISRGAVGGHTAYEARIEFDRLEMSYAEAIGGPVRTLDRSRFVGSNE